MAPQLANFLVEALRLTSAASAAAVIGYVFIVTKLVPKRVITETYLGPFTDFFRRYGKGAFLILALISTYRIADVIMGVMANVFYVD